MTATSKANESASGHPAPADGICMTCNRAADCLFLARATRPVLHCEDFDDTRAAPPEPQPSGPVARPRPRPRALNVQGICINCENLPTCTYPRPEGGLWHCEEYR